MDGFGAFDGGHFDDSLGAESTRVHLGDFLQLGGKVDLFHEVEVVVAARGAVGTEAYGDASSAFFHDGSYAAGQHHVAGRIVNAPDALFGQELAIGFIDPDAVRGDDVRTEQADAVHVLDGSSMVLGEAVVEFLFDFGDMDQNRRVIFLGEGLHVVKGLFRAEIDGVGRDGGMD